MLLSSLCNSKMNVLFNNFLFYFKLISFHVDCWAIYPLPFFTSILQHKLAGHTELSMLNLKVQITLMSSKSLVGVVEDTGGSWLGFLFLIMMRTGTQCPKQPMFKNSAFYVEFEGAKNPHVLEVLGWSCGGLWRFLTWVLVPDNDWDGSIIFKMTYVPNLSFLHWIERCKKPSCPQIPGWSWGGLWRFLTGVLVTDHEIVDPSPY